MADIGETLRASREEQGISLEEAEAATRIRARFLEALEENNLDILGGDVYVRGFVRNYAAFLGLDTAPLLAQIGVVENPLPPVAPSTSRYLAEPLQSNPVPVGRILLMSTTLLLVGILGFSLWWQPALRDSVLARAGFRAIVPAGTATIIASPAGEPLLTGPNVITQTQVIIEPYRSPTPTGGLATAVPTATLPPRTPTPDPNATTVPTAAATQVVAVEGVVLGAEIVADTWVRVYVDSQSEPVIERTLRVGESFQWVGNETVSLRAGNAGGISLTLNGQSIGVLGQPGEVVERRWQRDPTGGSPVLVDPSS